MRASPRGQRAVAEPVGAPDGLAATLSTPPPDLDEFKKPEFTMSTRTQLCLAGDNKVLVDIQQKFKKVGRAGHPGLPA